VRKKFFSFVKKIHREIFMQKKKLFVREKILRRNFVQ
jgi:hypothetical protein